MDLRLKCNPKTTILHHDKNALHCIVEGTDAYFIVTDRDILSYMQAS